MSKKMPVNARSKVIAFNLKTISAAVVSAALFSSAYAAGLGKLTVLSSLGQPLHAEIELTSVSKDEAGSLAVKLASTEAFKQANIDFNPALFSLRFAIEQRSGRQFIRVTSTQPINEPFVDMLLEVGAGNTRLVREYTFLLDPADLRKSQPVQMAAPSTPASISRQPQPIVQTESVPQPVSSDKSVAVNKPAPPAPIKRAPAAEPKPEAKRADAGEAYQVKKGDTLAKIAAQTKPDGVSLDQMLVALQRANPNAFIGNNINRLRAGQILSVPDAQTASGISNSEAKGIVVAQATDFNAYRNKLAGQVTAATAQPSDAAKQSATGKITTKVEEQPTAANEAKDKLKLSKSTAAAAVGTDKAGAVAPAPGAEDRIAKDKALAESNARVKELEKNVSDLQKILEIKNKDLADKQKQADIAKAERNATPPAATPVPATGAAATVTPPVPAKPATNAAVPAVTPPAPAPSAAESPAVTPVPPAAVPTADPAVAASDPQAPPAADVKPEVAVAEKPAVVVPPKKPVVAVTPAPEPSFVDDLLENPLLLSLAAVLLAGLGAVGIYSARRRRERAEFQDSNILTDSSLKANSLFGSTGGQSVDTNNSVFNSNFTPSASQLDTNEVDPVAEADVYIAYGRDAQAEEILKEALRTQPERNAVRVKLLEIYAQRKDLRAFEIMSSELYSITKGTGEDWLQAANLGATLDPKNPLYAGGKPADAASANPNSATAPTEELDELDLAALLNTTRGASTTPLEDFNTVETGDYNFNDTAGTKTEETSSDIDQPKKNEIDFIAEAAPEIAPQPEPQSVVVASNELDFDFDLESMGIKEVVLPPADVNKSSSLDAMDFDFNQDAPVNLDLHKNDDAENAALPTIDGADFDSMQINVPDISGTSNAAQTSSPAPTALDFDLSDITLDLNPSDTKSVSTQDTLEAGNDLHSNVAEMSTKLDLALAYQEIGDKEGARELLDEVVKGGSTEQIDKAKSMIQKLA